MEKYVGEREEMPDEEGCRRCLSLKQDLNQEKNRNNIYKQGMRKGLGERFLTKDKKYINNHNKGGRM